MTNTVPRAFSQAIKVKRSLFFVLFLLIAYFVVLVCSAIGVQGGEFVRYGAFVFSLFLVQSLLAPAAMVLMRLYLTEQNGKKVSIKQLFFSSLELLVTAILLPLPLLIAFLVVFALLALFLFLTWIPVLGHLFGIFLAFAPLILNLGVVLLFIASLALFYLLLPQIAFDKSFDRKTTLEALKQRLKQNPLRILKEGFWALLPLALTAAALWLALLWTTALPFMGANAVERGMQLLVMGVPGVCLLTPVIILFFHLSVDALLNDKPQKPLEK